MILINQKWWTVCFCWLSCLQHSCIHHRKTLLWQESFTTCQVRRRTGDLCDSQISDISDGLGHITLEAPWPAPAASINYLLLMLKNVQFPSLLMKSSDAVLKFQDSESFAFRGGGGWGGYFCQSRDLNLSLSSSLNKDLHFQPSSELNLCPACICKKWVLETNPKLPATHKNVNE